MARSLLRTLEEEKLVLDWRKTKQKRAAAGANLTLQSPSSSLDGLGTS